MTISEAFRLYDLYGLQANNFAPKTQANYRTACNSLIRNIGDAPIELLTEDAVIRWKVILQQEGKSANYIYSCVKCLCKVLRYCRQQGRAVINPDSIDVPRRKRKTNHTYLTVEEIEKTVAATRNPRDKAIVSALFHTGSRISALLSVDREYYEYAPATEHGNKELWVEDKAGNKSRLYFNTTVQAHIDAYLATRHDQLRPLFTSSQGKRITVSRVEQILHELEEVTGIRKNITPHVYRHSYASDIIYNGGSLKSLQVLMNHASIQVTGDIYSHLENREEEVFMRYHSH